jgi:transposase-like protein
LANDQSDARKERGLDIAKRATIAENSDGSFSVPSQSVEEIAYRVVKVEGGYSCNCPDFVQRHVVVGECKHCHAVRFWIALKVELQEKPRPKVFADDATQCAKCGSIRVIKFGIRDGKQAFKCSDCGHRFTELRLLRKSKYTPEMVSLTLDLYFSGTSLRKTARIVNDHFGLSVGNATIYRWIQKFVPRISEYARTLTPELSADWHADELFVKMKDGINYKAHYGGEAKNIAFLWNVMDRKTRFLLASKLSRWRDVAGADRAYREALSNAGGSRPEALYTDALKSYQTLVASLPESERPQHIAKAGIRKPQATNNRIERLNGTVRERVKVQRGWKNPASKIAEGQRIHYNFVKPHESLEGQTPADRAGVGVEGENKWLALLKAALTTQNGAEN